MGRSRWTGNAALAAVLLTLMSLWFFLHNPRIEGTSYGDAYRCLTPWDTVFNGVDNLSGGDPPEDAADVAARCRQAGERSFNVGVGTGVAAVAALVAAAVLALRNRRPE